MSKSLFIALLTSSLFLSQTGVFMPFDPPSAQAQTIQSKDLPAQAHWVNRNFIVWDLNTPLNELTLQFNLHYSPQANLKLTPAGITGGKVLPLKIYIPSHQAFVTGPYPFLQGFHLSLPQLTELELQEILQSQMILEAQNVQGEIIGRSNLQTPLVLDQLYAYTGSDLGPSFDAQGRPSLKLWAPTAQAVQLKLVLAGKQPEYLPMTRQHQGVWTIQGEPAWKNANYLYQVIVYSPYTGQLENFEVTDPYSTSLTTNSQYSQIVDLKDPAYIPSGWEKLKLYTTPQAPVDRVMYELHVRDFSIADPTVAEKNRGKFTAFSETNSNGINHLKALAESGITHLHLLPVFDIATIEEDPTQQKVPIIPQVKASSDLQQAAIGAVRHQDAYNWGYDPLHYGVPEGSYSTHPEGPTRILEFRQMVQSLEKIGLKLVMDVVYNHTHGAGTDPRAVLDKIVPGYYYRWDAQGKIQNTSCCPDTATEHQMMEKLMIDTLLRWVTDYKVGGFRFDLMGHHTTNNLKNIRKALDNLTLEKDGVDGRQIYLYGEGWKFGSLEAKYPELAMHQVNAYGLGVGTFNDRLRDSARGGNFDHATRSDQGFITGLYTDPNHSPDNNDTPTDPSAQKSQLLNYTDNIRLSLAGNLRHYRFKNATGQEIMGQDLAYRGQKPAGYAASPAENINYVSAHDNYTLWDQIAAKAPFKTAPRERAKMQQLGLALVLLGQGVPFLHAGSEILRSKSGDGDSYDSGDWFNALDWRYFTNGWGRGLPGAWRNQKEWDFWKKRLEAPQFQPLPDDILSHLAQTHRLLRLRRNHSLLRLQTAEEIQARVAFLPGSEQIPGLIAMSIRDDLPEQTTRDAKHAGLLIFLNARPQAQTFQAPLLQRNWQVAPELLAPISLKINGKMEVFSAPLKLQSLHLQPGEITLPARSVVVLRELRQ